MILILGNFFDHPLSPFFSPDRYIEKWPIFRYIDIKYRFSNIVYTSSAYVFYLVAKLIQQSIQLARIWSWELRNSYTSWDPNHHSTNSSTHNQTLTLRRFWFKRTHNSARRTTQRSSGVGTGLLLDKIHMHPAQKSPFTTE